MEVYLREDETSSSFGLNSPESSSNSNTSLHVMASSPSHNQSPAITWKTSMIDWL